MTKQFVTDKGIRKRNPAWHANDDDLPVAVAVPFVNRDTALVVVSTPPEEEEEIVITPMYQDAVLQYQQHVEPVIFAQQVDTNTNHNGLEELNRVLAKYEVPMGILSKLLGLSAFEKAEIIVDDSSSMTLFTDANEPNGERLTRWMEAKWRISQMMELMAYVVSPIVTIRFLNRKDEILLQRGSQEMPTAYIERVEGILKTIFDKGPCGSTPALEAIQASLNRDTHLKVLRFFLGDGQPNGGVYACRQIESLLMNRANPANNPFTFMSCTNEDQATEWMKVCEEKALYCSEFDDYGDESREILKDQGQAFPYSYGLHLVAQLVAAFNPDDLDALDESVPFSKMTMDNILGYHSSPEEYKYYFDSFLQAQRKSQHGHTPYQRRFVQQLPSLYEQFATVETAKDIAAVAQYKSDLRANQQQTRNGAHGSPPAAPAADECCVIL